jgi:Putative transposase
VTHLRKMMLEELQRCNYAQNTMRSYIRILEDFSRSFHRAPDRLQKSPLAEVSDGHSRTLAGKASPGTSSDALRACRFHFTSPPLALQNKKVVYDLLFRTSAETLLEVARDPEHLGAQSAFSVLHSWSQKLELHPHVHCVMPAGGLSADDSRWIKPGYDFFLPVEVPSRVFRGKFHDALKQAFENGQLNFHGDLKHLAQPKIFAAWLRKDWVVYTKPPFGGPDYVLRYLGRYTHRVAISNHQLVSFADHEVTFRWRDSAHNNEQRLMTLFLDEFLRRFLLHVLPDSFVRIRNFGFVANRRRATFLPLCFSLVGSHRKQSKICQAPRTPLIFGSVPTAFRSQSELPTMRATYLPRRQSLA